MNDAERLIFEGNLRRLKNKLNIRSETDPTAEVFEFGTKEKVTPGGIASLTEKAGQKSPPGTLMGNIESRIKQLEARGEDLSKMKGQTLEDIMTDALQSKGLSKQMYNEGLVRATARDIITNDIKSGKLKLPKELEQQILEGGGEPIDVLRNVYGEDALEVLDSLIPEFSKLRTSTEAEKLARSKFTFKPDVNRPKGSMSLDEAKKAEQENISTPKKPDEPEEFATGGRVGFANGTEAPVYRILADGSLGPRIITDSMVKNFFGDSTYDGEDLKKAFGENITFMSDEGYQKEKALNQQLEKYKVQGENPDGSWYTKYNIPSSVYGLAEGGLATMFVEKR